MKQNIKNRRWVLKIRLNGTLNWDIIQEYSQLNICKKEAKELKDSTVKEIIIKDKVTGNIISI